MGARARGNAIQIDFVYRGVRCRETLKLEPTKPNMKYAHRLHSTITLEIAIGTFDYRKHFPDSKRASLFINKQSGNQLVKDALLSYLEAKRRVLAPSTYHSYETAVRCHLIPAFGKLKLVDLSTQVIRQWMGGLTVSNKRINNVLIPFRGMLDDVFADGAIDRNPMDRIRNLKIEQDDPEPFTFDEQKRILKVLPDQFRNMIQFAFWTGLRTGELIALEWSDIDMVRRSAYVRRNFVRGELKGPKTRAGKREVTLLPRAIAALEDQMRFTYERGKRVFHNPVTNQPWSADYKIRYPYWINGLKDAGVRYRNPYQTRHTYASMLLTMGVNPTFIARQMGHTNMQMVLQKYGRYMREHTGLEVKKITDFMSQFGHNLGIENEKPPVKTGGYIGGGSGTRTPDTRIMIPLL